MKESEKIEHRTQLLRMTKEKKRKENANKYKNNDSPANFQAEIRGEAFMKKLIIVLLAFVMVFFNVVPAMAAEHEHEQAVPVTAAEHEHEHTVPVMVAEDERERIIIEVDTIQDFWEFYYSPAYDYSKAYSFIIKYHPMARAVCPICGYAAWTGSNYKIENVDVYFQDCPQGGGLNNDRADVMFYTYQERCRICGYEVVHDQYFFLIDCHHGLSFQAWDGQRVEDGYDRHEDKRFWYIVPAMYH